MSASKRVLPEDPFPTRLEQRSPYIQTMVEPYLEQDNV